MKTRSNNMALKMWGVTSIFISIFTRSSEFYVPGVAPLALHHGDSVPVKAVKLTSSKTQLPYEYYSLPFCHPKEGVVYSAENLGEVLRGDRIVNTPYVVSMGVDMTCRLLCQQETMVKLTKQESRTFIDRIKHDYNVHLIVDNLPCATKFMTGTQVHVDQGYRLGFINGNEVYIHNHLKLILSYHLESNSIRQVVGFEVKPYSIDSKYYTKKGDAECALENAVSPNQNLAYQKLNGNGETIVTFSYDVTWVESNVRYASRWDTYLSASNVQVHWFSIVNSIVVVLFLSGILAMIMVRTLRRDIAQYNMSDDLDETMEESGWKLVHGDVFRPPRHTLSLTALVGAGIQVFFMAIVTIFFAMLGMLSPAYRGALMSSGIFLYMFMGLFAGFYAGRLYKTMRGTLWRRAAFQTALMHPGIVFATFFVLNFFIWGKHSSGAVPFGTMLTLIVLWLGISVPLVFVGFYFGFRKVAYQHPVRTNQIPRQVPVQAWYMNNFFGSFLAGVLPFGSMFIELFFIFSALWENKFYYLFGFLFLVFIILIVSVSQIAIVMVYFQLCREDYHWWWRSFIVSGGPAVYMFLYSVFYFYTKLQITEFVPMLLYFGYTLIIVFTFWVLTGTIGFFASYCFIRRIYGAIKVD